MEVFVTGATGYIGTAVCDALQAAGHDVVGLARSDESADRLRSAGRSVVRGNLSDLESLAEPARDAGAVIHLALAEGGDAGELDRGAVEALIAELEGSGQTFVYTSGCWVLGDTGEEVADEESERAPVDLVAWRRELEPAVLDASARDVGTVVIRPAMVYGRGGGIPGMLVEEAGSTGRVRVVERGLQEWPMVHADDLADLYVRALDAAAGSLYQAAHGPSYRARDVALGACLAAGEDPSVEHWPLDEAREELGGFADALALSQRMSAAKAREELGWDPGGATLLEELVSGSYAADA